MHANGTALARPRLLRRRTPAAVLAFTALLFAFALLPPVVGSASLLPTFLGVGALLAAWAGALWVRGRGTGFEIELVRPLPAHFVQMGVQLALYGYWAWSWRPVLDEAPLILAQVVFLYNLDALLSWTRGRPWRLGLGPVPVVLSVNLFLWFRDDWFLLQFLMIATCALGKEFVRWQRDGRRTHVFNPSAFGLAVFALILIATGKTAEWTLGFEMASSLGLAPHWYLLIFGVGLVVQYLFAVTLMTLSAAATLVLLGLVYTGATGSYHFVDTNIPVAIFLGLHLLITDPSTSPRTNLGRVLFGVLYGVGSFAFYGVLRDLGAPEFFDKLLTVPLMNSSVRGLDRLARAGRAGRLERWQERFRPRRLNLVHMGCWTALFVTLLGSGFVQAAHPGASVAFWKRAAAEGRPRAAENLVRLLSSRAERGSARALDELGVLYRDGELVPADERRATTLFARAFEAGSRRGGLELVAQFLAVEDARPGELVGRALDGLERNADRDLPGRRGRSAFLVGFAYETGRGRPRDLLRAERFYRRASARGDLDASKALARLALGSLAGTDLRPAAAVLERACLAGDVESCLLLASLLELGRGLEPDRARARALLEQAARQGCEQASAALEDPEGLVRWSADLRARWPDPRPPRP